MSSGLLFHRVILMSGSALSPLVSGLSNGQDLAKRFADKVKCPTKPPSTMLHCLRQIPLQHFVESEVRYTFLLFLLLFFLLTMLRLTIFSRFNIFWPRFIGLICVSMGCDWKLEAMSSGQKGRYNSPTHSIKWDKFHPNPYGICHFQLNDI